MSVLRIRPRWNMTAIGVSLAGLALLSAAPAEARHHRHHHRPPREDHGDCLRFDKTTGTVAGAGAGGILGNAIGGTGGLVVGAVGGGVAGHELARDGRKRCR